MLQSTEQIILRGITIVGEEATIKSGSIYCKDGKIKAISTNSTCKWEVEEDATILDFTAHAGYQAIPGFIDLHIHGADGADTMDGNTTALQTLCRALPKEGTTSFLPTTITQSDENITNAVASVSQYQKKKTGGESEIIGIHLEGPFISAKKAGAQPSQFIAPPSLEKFEHWQNMAGGMIKIVTLAPELYGGFSFIQQVTETGTTVSLGHTDASFVEVEQSVKCGATQVTHLYNQMTGLHHREPGVVGAALALSDIKAEIICDGVHVHPQAVRIAYEAKGAEGLLLVTDSMRAKGLDNGVYDLGGQKVKVCDGTATLHDGTLAGSVLQMIDAVKNVMKFTGCTLQEGVQMASANPAKQIGVFDRKGSLTEGKDADIVIVDENYDVVMTFCKGVLAHRKDGMYEASNCS